MKIYSNRFTAVLFAAIVILGTCAAFAAGHDSGKEDVGDDAVDTSTSPTKRKKRRLKRSETSFCEKGSKTLPRHFGKSPSASFLKRRRSRSFGPREMSEATTSTADSSRTDSPQRRLSNGFKKLATGSKRRLSKVFSGLLTVTPDETITVVEISLPPPPSASMGRIDPLPPAGFLPFGARPDSPVFFAVWNGMPGLFFRHVDPDDLQEHSFFSLLYRMLLHRMLLGGVRQGHVDIETFLTGLIEGHAPGVPILVVPSAEEDPPIEWTEDDAQDDFEDGLVIVDIVPEFLRTEAEATLPDPSDSRMATLMVWKAFIEAGSF